MSNVLATVGKALTAALTAPATVAAFETLPHPWDYVIGAEVAVAGSLIAYFVPYVPLTTGDTETVSTTP